MVTSLPHENEWRVRLCIQNPLDICVSYQQLKKKKKNHSPCPLQSSLLPLLFFPLMQSSLSHLLWTWLLYYAHQLPTGSSMMMASLQWGRSLCCQSWFQATMAICWVRCLLVQSIAKRLFWISYSNKHSMINFLTRIDKFYQLLCRTYKNNGNRKLKMMVA